jgi:hypothetical protein
LTLAPSGSWLKFIFWAFGNGAVGATLAPWEQESTRRDRSRGARVPLEEETPWSC